MDNIYIFTNDINYISNGGKKKSHLYTYQTGKCLCGKCINGTMLVDTQNSGFVRFIDILQNNPVDLIKLNYCKTCLKKFIKTYKTDERKRT